MVSPQRPAKSQRWWRHGGSQTATYRIEKDKQDRIEKDRIENRAD